jgi:hypothetical protein
MIYKVGDTVTIASLSELHARGKVTINGNIQMKYDLFVVNVPTNDRRPPMTDFCGCLATIRSISGSYKFLIDLDRESWNWTEEMFDCDPFRRRVR